ncbi:hypothetical protein BV22DRAFT_942151 [Leucogyrophana mollusca]|uniref:Uncharacterized protein n=1 Tax=Leucogyrophana mollusca TaxID=85980 RepID=A0ACB8ATS9_9AGAM|nr:hypothetical protein BV22DRAFT_942151 [Leucogyrophana mollusca]
MSPPFFVSFSVSFVAELEGHSTRPSAALIVTFTYGYKVTTRDGPLVGRIQKFTGVPAIGFTRAGDGVFRPPATVAFGLGFERETRILMVALPQSSVSPAWFPATRTPSMANWKA